VTARDRVLQQVAARVAGARRIAVDGVDGAGKSTLADELACVLRAQGRSVLRASVDGFHRPRDERYRPGRHSPEGFYQDSFDYPSLRRVLLDPLGPDGSGRCTVSIHDVVTDTALLQSTVVVDPAAVLVLDGIFLSRPELAGCFEATVFVQASWSATYTRMAVRDRCPPDPDDPANARYRRGQQLYLERCRPVDRATVVVDNTDLAAPLLLR